MNFLGVVLTVTINFIGFLPVFCQFSCVQNFSFFLIFEIFTTMLWSAHGCRRFVDVFYRLDFVFFWVLFFTVFFFILWCQFTPEPENS